LKKHGLLARGFEMARPGGLVKSAAGGSAIVDAPPVPEATTLPPPVVNGDVRYTTGWQPSTEGEIQVYSWTYPDYRAKYAELWPQRWRLRQLTPGSRSFAYPGPAVAWRVPNM
jgi:hypothetical protein